MKFETRISVDEKMEIETREHVPSKEEPALSWRLIFRVTGFYVMITVI
jgi:hypothetical protein